MSLLFLVGCRWQRWRLPTCSCICGGSQEASNERHAPFTCSKLQPTPQLDGWQHHYCSAPNTLWRAPSPCADTQVLQGVQVAELEVPYVLMHMRGNPTTMQQPQHTQYQGDVCAQVGQELQAACHAACQAGIPPWRLILDPGEIHAPDQSHVDRAGVLRVMELGAAWRLVHILRLYGG